MRKKKRERERERSFSMMLNFDDAGPFSILFFLSSSPWFLFFSTPTSSSLSFLLS